MQGYIAKWWMADDCSRSPLLNTKRQFTREKKLIEVCIPMALIILEDETSCEFGLSFDQTKYDIAYKQTSKIYNKQFYL
jgi:hypothetical protein